MSLPAINLFPIRILAIDPGLTTGFAAFNDKGYPFATGTINEPGGLKEANLRTHVTWFKKLKNRPQTIVLEQFRVRPGGETNGQRVIASEVIGVVRTWAILNSIELVMSEPANLKDVCLLAGIVMPKQHSKTHVPSAIAHGTFYAVNAGIRTTVAGGLKVLRPPG